MKRLYWLIRNAQKNSDGWMIPTCRVAWASTKMASDKGYTDLKEILNDEDFWGLLWG